MVSPFYKLVREVPNKRDWRKFKRKLCSEELQWHSLQDLLPSRPDFVEISLTLLFHTADAE